MTQLITQHNVEQGIFVIRGKKVMIDRDLSSLYGVKTKYLNQQVRRNIDRFPDTFMLQLTAAEKTELVAICNRFESMKHSRINPFQAINKLMAPPTEPPKRKIGFHTDNS